MIYRASLQISVRKSEPRLVWSALEPSMLFSIFVQFHRDIRIALHSTLQHAPRSCTSLALLQLLALIVLPLTLACTSLLHLALAPRSYRPSTPSDPLSCAHRILCLASFLPFQSRPLTKCFLLILLAFLFSLSSFELPHLVSPLDFLFPRLLATSASLATSG